MSSKNRVVTGTHQQEDLVDFVTSYSDFECLLGYKTALSL